MIHFGLIGHGTHAQGAVVPAMQTARGVRLTAAADLAPENLAKLADKRVFTYTNYREMLAREDLDAVYVATRVEAHCETVVAALNAGKHVITEKPMAVSVRECRRMMKAAEKASRLLAVDFESRFIPGFRQIREWIAEGRIGRVQALHITSMWDGHKTEGPLAERRRRFLESSGCLDCGIHKLDLARYFTGGGAWHDIRAFGAWFGEGVKYPPHISIMARLDPGILSTLNASFAFTAYIPRRIKGIVHNWLVILGDRGVIVLHQNPQGEKFLELASETHSTVIPFTEYGHGSVISRLLTGFSRCIRDGLPLPPEIATGYDGLMAQICADRANSMALKARGGENHV